MDFKAILTFILLEVAMVTRHVLGQVMMEELTRYNIDQHDMNGTELYTGLTIDQLIMQASGGVDMAQNLILGDNGLILAELDMKINQDQFNALYESPTYSNSPDRGIGRRSSSRTRRNQRKNRRTKRKAIRDVILRWDDGIIPYKFVRGHFDSKEEYLIKSAMTEWEKYTCLRFRPATKTDRNIVRFQNGLGCNSQLGMVGGEQPLNLDRNGCRYRGLYLHEIGHAIGLVHEHQLPDRDAYIEILYQNVQPNMRIWFNKYSSQEVDQMQVPYEYSSVMHYGITAFSSDGSSQTIRSKQPGKEKSIGRVYRKELSFTDVKIVNLMYQCEARCADPPVCNEGGYVDQNCRCICPDGSDKCSQRQNKDEIDPSCINAADDSWQCAVWAAQGECDRNPRFMLESCRKACKLCGNKDEDIGTCKDKYETSKCETWKERGEWLTNKEWMSLNCKKTCNACNENKDDPSVACPNKFGNDSQCDKWASQGECDINPAWMPSNCRKSCRMCDKTEVTVTTTTTVAPDGVCQDEHNSVECQKWAGEDQCTENPNWMLANCQESCGKCGGDGGAQECLNTWDDSQCEGWAKKQECLKNSVWMHSKCHKACTGCTPDGSTETNTPRPTERPVTEGSTTCVNNHKSDSECENWAKHGNCDINKWMTKHCAKACKSCPTTDGGGKDTPTTKKPDTTDKSKETATVAPCEDKKEHCKPWADHGFCEDNPRMAFNMCKKSCRFCNTDTDCKDKHQLCPIWAKGEQCEKNGGYMYRNCKKSCKVC